MKMTIDKAIMILDPETTAEALAEIEYYAGFYGHTAKVQVVNAACELAVAALRKQKESRWVPVTEQLPNAYERVWLWDEIDEEIYAGNKTPSGEWEVPGFESSEFRITHWKPMDLTPPRGGERGKLEKEENQK